MGTTATTTTRGRAARLAAGLLGGALLLGAAGCAAAQVRYPGRADVRDGDRPLIWIEPTGSSDTQPWLLRAPVGTEVTWLNASPDLVFIRFYQPVEEVCGEPVRFHRTYDGASFVSALLPLMTDARLCFARPGRYDFVVAGSGGGGGGDRSSMQGGGGNGGGRAAVRYGTVVIE
ncbi:MAG TPA: hypothetical protein VNM66_03640 [Thermodesulfobacteriota bacterium]|nr:hypothetical protein [Thermodesulfobacteriota bacterium]